MSVDRLTGAIRDNLIAVIQPVESHKLHEMANAIAKAVIDEITTHATVNGLGLSSVSGGAVSGVTPPGAIS
jgi:hypothetical protein